MRKKLLSLFLSAAVFLLLSLPALTHAERASLSIVGSSTVYPFATAVAERFSHLSSLRTPRIEATGSGGGFKLFCRGIGFATPDIVTASRPVTTSEISLCRKNGVEAIVEVKIGYDGIVMANSRTAPSFHFQLRDLYLAMAERVPDPEQGKTLVPNFYSHWSQLDHALPTLSIRVYGPPPTSGTRDAFLELMLERGARQLSFFQDDGYDTQEFKRLTNALREDGRYIDIGENDNAIIRRLENTPESFGLFGYSFFDQNRTLLHAASLDGREPSVATIQDGSYPGSRSLYLYVKKAHVGRIPGIRRYLKEFTSERAWGPTGYLARKGLVPLSQEERLLHAHRARSLTVMRLK